ncbi:uncharacterized protein A1O9_04431 [Exophiala aquamarina CBS 119918]|uniref:Cyclohexanone monooxygenase n=1 Tax=Exophiala aquamarina CBS 119918 TaxID=1182545 RepID=A0A072PVI2_9EURO|nr:uncharacterized protein A1O9_04431 [Exophiala aquamarina CBS 119918]KEF59585.1 hypothetical protein A1O9_04431 [Exophiala aquamarina CBS 119918]
MESIGIKNLSKYDVLIIGAGLSGICSLHHIRQRFPSWRVKVLEAGSDVGGTWYWNRYPGARFDSESISYGFSWDQDLLNEWHWKEAFSPQPETLRYIQHVAKKHDLYRDIQFNTRIVSATWQDSGSEDNGHTWTFTDTTGTQYRTTFFISCLGFLSSPTLPNISGIETFSGQSFHTSRWPDNFDMSEFTNKRVGVIGTGATGIQTITELAKAPLKSLSVFQRTANWSAPLRNTKITVEEMSKIRQGYASVFQQCAETPMGFLHQADPRRSGDVDNTERTELWNKLYAQPGFGKWLGVFQDTYTDREANKLYSDFMAQKIRDRVSDPTTADDLIPTNHGFGLRRVPLESGYFEAFNQPNVHLVNLQKTPIDCITPTGITTLDGKSHDLDVLIFATGFDAITGAFREIKWSVKNKRPLLGYSTSTTVPGKDAVWIDHQPKTFLGLTLPSCPNMFMVLGPHQPFGNATRSIEHAVDVISQLLQHCSDNNYTYVEPTDAAVREWTEHVAQCSQGLLSNDVDSWMTGVNKNIAGKATRSVARYAGSAVEYRRRCEECRLHGWKGLAFRTTANAVHIAPRPRAEMAQSRL